MKKITIFVFLALFAVIITAQDQNEINSEVKELTAFHTVIYKMWHNAWPEKDIIMLQSLLPDIEKYAQDIKSAKLPGILRDKQANWDANIIELTNCIENYKTACIKNDSVGLLNSAEKLHSQFEKLVRITKPVLKEVDQFHQELYLVYHYYMPENSTDKISNSAKILETRINELKKVQLPDRLASKKSNFETAVLKLESSIVTLNELLSKGNDNKTISEAVISVHSRYQDLEKIFN